MKAILISSDLRTIEEIDFQGGLNEIYRLLNCTTIDAVRLSNGDYMYVDDEGLLKAPGDFLYFEGLHAPIAGRGLIVGSDGEGGDADCSTRVTDLKVTFMDAFEAYTLAVALA